jgi:hypothetical protein
LAHVVTAEHLLVFLVADIHGNGLDACRWWIQSPYDNNVQGNKISKVKDMWKQRWWMIRSC